MHFFQDINALRDAQFAKAEAGGDRDKLISIIRADIEGLRLLARRIGKVSALAENMYFLTPDIQYTLRNPTSSLKCGHGGSERQCY